MTCLHDAFEKHISDGRQEKQQTHQVYVDKFRKPWKKIWGFTGNKKVWTWLDIFMASRSRFVWQPSLAIAYLQPLYAWADISDISSHLAKICYLETLCFFFSHSQMAERSTLEMSKNESVWKRLKPRLMCSWYALKVQPWLQLSKGWASKFRCGWAPSHTSGSKPVGVKGGEEWKRNLKEPVETVLHNSKEIQEVIFVHVELTSWNCFAAQ